MKTGSVRIGLALIAVALAGCGDSGTDLDVPPLTGTWAGALEVTPGFVVNITLTLLETQDGNVSGTGTLVTPEPETVAISVRRGLYTFPEFGVVLAFGSDPDPAVFEGTVTPNGSQLRGILDSRSLVLTRQ